MISSLNEIEVVKKYLDRIGAEAVGLFTAAVKETEGAYWRETVRLRFARDGKVSITKGSDVFRPTEDEQAAICEAFAAAPFPTCVYGKNLGLPSELKEVDPETIFHFTNEAGDTVMLQQRVQLSDKKIYVPWTKWSDGVWRRVEPDVNKLPLWGLDTCKDQVTAFLSEGAKAARAVARLINPRTREEQEAADNFPWINEFKNAASVGFVGGALCADRTDFSVLKRLGIQRVIMICDNDAPGLDPVPEISSAVDLPFYVIRFSQEWNQAFDLADPWPEKFFKKIGDRKYYHGPSFHDCLYPATYLTKLVPVVDSKGKEKMAAVLRGHAKNAWFYAESQGLFISADFPQIQLSADKFDAVMAPFTHRGTSAAGLLLQEFACRVTKLAYRPDKKERKIILDGELAINVYRPPTIVAREGDITPFLAYMEYLIPDANDRKETLRWLATLVSKPQVRLLYSLLLISNQTGVGKSILAERILTPLVGESNVSFPSENTILESFNSWIAKKRLVVIGELYAGSSWKMANRLKSYITDRKLVYNEKYMQAVTIDNFGTFFASSNSPEPIKLDELDRRWLVPTVTEVRWSDEEFDAFMDWLDAGGISIIKWYFDHFKDYVRPGEKSPSTSKKNEIIESGREPSINRCHDLAFKIRNEKLEVAIGDRDLHSWLKAVLDDKSYTKPLEERKALKSKGMVELKEIMKDGRMFFNNQQQNIMLSEETAKKCRELLDDGARREYVRFCLRTPSQILTVEERM